MTTLLIASSGGHLKELWELAPRFLAPGEDRLWVTFDTEMSRSLLAGEPIRFVPHVHPRDARHAAENIPLALRASLRLRPTRAVSTGAGVALAWLPAARLAGAECHFIDTATRTHGPSFCGRRLLTLPGVQVYSQYERGAIGPIRFAGSVFDGYAPRPQPRRPVRRLLVTVGSQDRWGFSRLLRRLLAVVPPEVEVRWQIGGSQVPELDSRSQRAMSFADLAASHTWADAVVAHAGVGSAMTALEQGLLPMLVPRRRQHREHVDDHQTEIADELSSRGLAATEDADALTWDLIEATTEVAVERTPAAPFVLVPPAWSR